MGWSAAAAVVASAYAVSQSGGPDVKMPELTPIPPPPTLEDATAKAENSADEFRRRRGRASTILTSPTGAANPNVGTQKLLGS